MENTETVISLRSVIVRLSGRTILDNVSFEVKKGEFVAVLGPNGAGKTMLLKLLLGLLKQAEGSVTVLGRPPRRGNGDIGYAPQHRVLETEVAVRARDVVGFGLDGNKWGIGFSNRKRDELIDNVLKEMDIHHLGNAPVGQLSGGEQQRVSIAQALITDPEILLLDEPLSNLDITHAQEVILLLTKRLCPSKQKVAHICRERKVTIMLVTHDINPLLPVVDRVLYMSNGRGVMGTPEEIITSDTLSNLYGTRVEVLRSGGRIFVTGAET
jgi:zinc/manganese transport system ATP-binding protein